MSKVQVDTIVDKDDISAPSLTKGAIVTGVCTATSFDGAISEWVLGANGSSDYTFTGSGLTGAENDPTLYLKRGQKYRFKNSSGGHPFRIQSTANGSAGTAYNDGVTNNDAGDGTTLEWDVQFDAPDVLYYQCTAHGSMGGKIYIGNSGNSSTLVDLNVSGVTTTGIATVTTSVVVGSAVTANADGVITAGVGTFGSVVSSGAISGTTGTFTGDVDIADKIVHTGDTNTAIRFPANDNITFETNGSERFRITAGTAGTCLLLTGDRVDSSNKTLRLTLNHYSFNTVNQINILGATTGSGFNRVHIGGNDDSTGDTCATEIKLYTGANSTTTNGTERLRIGSAGQIGIAGANYGTSGQVLTSGGASAAVQWATPSGGGWIPVASNSVTSSDTTNVLCSFTNCFDSTYDHYRIEFTCHYNDTSSSSGSDLYLQQYDSSAWRTGSDYDYRVNWSGYGTPTRSGNEQSGNGNFPLSVADQMAWTGHLDIWNTHETTIQATWRLNMDGYAITQPNGPYNQNRLGVNAVCSAANGSTPVAVTGFRIKNSSGAFLSNGNIVVYGLKTS